jgi:tungstate transport system substrate-binding protein
MTISTFPNLDTKPMKKLPLALLFSLLLNLSAASAGEVLRLSTTTSTENSGLLAVLNPPFENQRG